MSRFSPPRAAAPPAAAALADAGARRPPPRAPETLDRGKATPRRRPASCRRQPARRAAEAAARLIDEIDLSKLDKLDEPEMRRQVRRLVAEFAREERLPLNGAELDELGASVFDEMVGLGPIEPLLQGRTHRRHPDQRAVQGLCGAPRRTGVAPPVRFRDNDHLLRIVNRIVAAVGRRIDESSPMVDARLPDGSRVNAAIGPITIDGAAVSIRKFSKKPYNLQRLVSVGAMPAPWPNSCTARCARGSRP